MSISIHPYLIARLYAIQEAFEQPGMQAAYAANITTPQTVPPPASSKSWDDLLKEDEDGKGGEGGGGGTIKGLRGKHAEAAKAAMRRMTRR